MRRRRNIAPVLSATQLVSRPTPAREVFTFQPLPAPPGDAPYRIASSVLDIVPAGGSRTFHIVGDDGGVVEPARQRAVVEAMAEDLLKHPEVSFCWHVGDWAYFNGGQKEWIGQFFEPRTKYDRVVIGKPGNHDGDPEEDGETSLQAFVKYQCDQQAPRLLPEMAEFGRDTVQQPNVYWTLQDDACTIIALYTNVPEGGEIQADQEQWFIGELRSASTDRPLVISLHHPPFSVDAHHGGSAHMRELLERCFTAADRCADLILSGHVHDYQRFDWSYWGRTIPCLVVGNSGYHNLHPFASDATPGIEPMKGIKFQAGDDKRWGYVRLTVGPKSISGEYTAIDHNGTVTPGIDTFNALIGGTP